MWIHALVGDIACRNLPLCVQLLILAWKDAGGTTPALSIYPLVVSVRHSDWSNRHSGRSDVMVALAFTYIDN